MKKILSLILAVVMLAGTAVIPATAEADAASEAVNENIYMQSDFSSDSAADRDFYIGAYTTQDENLVGYQAAKALQTKNGWMTYDFSCSVMIIPDEEIPEADAQSRYFSIGHNNVGEMANGLRNGSRFISFIYDVNNGLGYLCNDTFTFNTNSIIAGPVQLDVEADDGDYHDFGMSITDQRIRCFFDGVCVIDYVDIKDEYYIGDVVDVKDPPIMVLWNENNCMMYEDIVITAPEYLYPLPETAVSLSLEAQPIKEGDTEIKMNLVATLPESVTGYELGYFGLDLSYDNKKMSVANEPAWLIGGEKIASEINSANPYKLLWISIDPADNFAAGSTTICELTFALNEPAVFGTDYVFTLAADEENGVSSKSSKDGGFTEFPYKPEDIKITGVTVVVEKKPVYGDANSDGKVDLNDVTLMLQSIAGWTGITVNTDLADVNCDGEAKLDDVTLILQSIAGWNVELGVKK